MNDIYTELGISQKVYQYADKIWRELSPSFEDIDDIAEFNQLKVLKAMQDNNLGEAHLLGTTGYGYNDIGRDTLESIYASIFHTEAALVRPQIISGTHALSIALMGNLKPGDELLSPVGRPYDTLEGVIGIKPTRGSLMEYDISYNQVELLDNGNYDYDNIDIALSSDRLKLVTIQRSKGYRDRPSLNVSKIGELVTYIRSKRPELIIMVDNCYGEFVEKIEPSQVGADMVVGSLIKNPGGGLAPLGGYIAGSLDCIENAAARLSAPGIGREAGASLTVLPSFYHGLFIAPTVTASAIKTATFASEIYHRLGYNVNPIPADTRGDIIQAIELGNKEAVIAFCQAIQKASPVDSYVTPMPWDMPGYDSEVIMASGSFVSGSSIELSADAPIREPFIVFFQGGLTASHGKYGIIKSLQSLINEGIISYDQLKYSHF